MAQEIELKFIVEKDSVDALRQHLQTLSGEHHEPVQLLNIYYETPDNWLRRHDMGLRIRGANGRYEMTMKIAGRVVGGLHQRPEYNIDINQPELELERFPAEVWPNGELPSTLAAEVQPLFSTDFWREKWLVTEGKSRIEIALDLGEVKAGEYQEPICELELELLEGETNDVLKLAPEDANTYVTGDVLSVIAPAQRVVEVSGGTWTFKGYDRESVTADATTADSEGNVTFVGVWEFTQKTSSPSGSGNGGQNGTNDAPGAGSAQGKASSGIPQTGDVASTALYLALIASAALLLSARWLSKR